MILQPLSENTNTKKIISSKDTPILPMKNVSSHPFFWYLCYYLYWLRDSVSPIMQCCSGEFLYDQFTVNSLQRSVWCDHFTHAEFWNNYVLDTAEAVAFVTWLFNDQVQTFYIFHRSLHLLLYNGQAIFLRKYFLNFVPCVSIQPGTWCVVGIIKFTFV